MEDEEEQTEVTKTTTTSETPNQTTRRTTSSVSGGAPSGIVVGQRLVYWLFGILESILLIRLVLSLLGANRGNAFADLIYSTTAPFVAPFQTLFNYQTQFGVSRFELETIVAMLVYGLVAYGILALLQIPRRGSTV
jgi:uncharacterized protein YggT (Ycf19 family)